MLSNDDVDYGFITLTCDEYAAQQFIASLDEAALADYITNTLNNTGEQE